MKTKMTVHDACQSLIDHTARIPVESMPVCDLWGRTASKSIVVKSNLPPVPQSAIDGFALHKADLDGQSSIRIRQYLKHGEITEEALSAGESVGVLTGAALPVNTAAVIPLELVEVRNQELTLPYAIKNSLNIKQPGEDLKKGDILLPAGNRITAGLVSALAALGINEIMAYRQPHIVIINLAPHIVAPYAPPAPGQILDSNGPLLECLIARDGGIVTSRINSQTDLVQARDDILVHADLVITVGSVFAQGECEAAGLLHDWNAEILFWGVNMQPGSHTGAGMCGKTPILCLPGNPAACLVAYELLAAPLLRHLQGLDHANCKVMAVCKNDFTTNRLDIPRFLRGKAYCTESGWFAEVLPGQKPSMIRSLIECNALIETLPGQTRIKAGEQVFAVLLESSSYIKR
ncbi:MAG: molybdopterin molybdotransferase MoeA [Candidatus Saccharibacteria bacterium]